MVMFKFLKLPIKGEPISISQSQWEYADNFVELQLV